LKKLNELLFRDDRRRLLFSSAVVGGLLILAALLPLCFRTEAAPETPEADPAARMALFRDYWQQTEDDRIGEKTESFGPETDDFCLTQMEALIRDCIDDPGLEHPAPTGRELVRLQGADGTGLSLCRMWLEAAGDWKNWMDVCFDADSGAIYYFYLSRERLIRSEQDGDAQDLTAETVAEKLAAHQGWSLYRLTETADGAWDAVFGTGTGAACYRITVKAYDNLIDVMLACE